MAAGMVVAFQIGKLPSAITTLQQDLNLSLVEAGWVLSLIFAISAIGGVTAGIYADRWGLRRVIAAGLVTTGVGAAAGGFAVDLPTLLVSRLLEGVGSVTVFVAGPGLILRATATRHLGLAMGMWGTYMPAGIAIMILATPALLALAGWRGLWFVNAALAWIFAAVFWAGTRQVPDASSAPPDTETAAASGVRRSLRRDMAAVLRLPGPWLLSLIFLLYAATYLVITAFLPKYLVDQFGYAPTTAAAAVAVIICANAGGNLTGGWLGHRGVPRWLLIVVALATMGVTGWLTYRPGFGDTACLALAFVFSYVGGLLPASVFGSVPRLAPDRSRIAGVNGLILQGTNAGQLVAPPVFALLVAAGGWPAGPWLTVGLTALGILVALALRRLEARA